MADERKDRHYGLAAGSLSLADIERRLRDEGWSQSVIDHTLAFVIETREKLSAIGELPLRNVRPH